MIFEKFSLKAQDFIENACRLAVNKKHPYVTPFHLLFSLLEKQEHQARQWFPAAHVDIGKLSARIESQLIIQSKAVPNYRQICEQDF
jgi:ATP-dependent Clp protease ATP-binding subunit ClpB